MVNSFELLNYTKEYLSALDSTIDLSNLDEETDLVAFGIESIQLLQMIIKIEKKYNLSLSMDKLASSCFKLSVNTILQASD